MTLPANPSVALVTGGTGFVGSHLVRRLVADGFDTHLLCRSASDFWRLTDVLPRVHRTIAPLEDAARLQAAVAAIRPAYIFHLASSTVVAGASADADELMRANLLGTANLLDACSQVDYSGLVSTGDSFEYSGSHQPHAEDEECRPASAHGVSKLAATLRAQSAARERGRPVLVLRLFSTYGPADHPRRLAPRVIAAALAGEPLKLSQPGISRDWVYIDDVVDLYIEAARNAGRLAGGVYNAGSGLAVTIGEVVETILRLTGASVPVQWGEFPAPPHDAFPWTADPRRTFEALAWRPRVPLEEGLSRTIAAMRASRPASLK